MALTCDVLSKLSQLSLDLQSCKATLIQYDAKIKKSIRITDSLKTTINSDYYAEVAKAKEQINLYNNNNNNL